MPQLISFGLQVFLIVLVGFYLDREIFNDLQPITYQPNPFLRIICDKPELCNPQVP